MTALARLQLGARLIRFSLSVAAHLTGDGLIGVGTAGAENLNRPPSAA
uniref:Uncharacterized protein n=1 Tax=Ralstonia solanacearum TaxID=305 RepID=A0A0S4WSV8_RALSL|nr:conserved protein of unknown function [Ralstonia solanacearum]